MAVYFSDILLCYSISLVDMFSGSIFCSTSLSLGIPSSLVEFVSILSRGNPSPFYFGRRRRRRLSVSLDFSVVRRV